MHLILGMVRAAYDPDYDLWLTNWLICRSGDVSMNSEIYGSVPWHFVPSDERVYLSLYHVADAPFHIQGDNFKC